MKSKAIKILVVCSANLHHGISPIIKNQLESLAESGIESKLFGIEAKGLFGYLNHIPSFIREVRKTDCSIVHAHYGLCGIVALFAIPFGKKVLISFMGDDLLFTKKTDGSITFVSRVLTAVNIFLARYFFHWNIVKSEEMARKLHLPKKTTIIPNGVRLNMLEPMPKAIARNQLKLSRKNIIVLFAGNPNRPEKNFKLAEEACNVLRGEYPELVLLPVFNVSFDEMRSYYYAADIVLMTSFHEGSPNVIKEAMVCNKPIVSTGVGDVENVFGETAGAFLTDYTVEKTVAQLKNAIGFLPNETTGRERICSLGLDAASVSKNVINIYHKIHRI